MATPEAEVKEDAPAEKEEAAEEAVEELAAEAEIVEVVDEAEDESYNFV